MSDELIPDALLSTSIIGGVTSLAILVASAAIIYLSVTVLTKILQPLFQRQSTPAYEARPFLFSKSEWFFRKALINAIRNDYLVMGKVRIADVLRVRKSQKKTEQEWWKHFSKISQKHVDYVLLHPSNGKILCCIELDDSSHQRKDRIERDRFVRQSFEGAGIPLISVPARRQYDPAVLRQQIELAIPTPNPRMG